MKIYTKLIVAAACLVVAVAQTEADRVVLNENGTENKIHLRPTRSVTPDELQITAESFGQHLMHKFKDIDRMIAICELATNVKRGKYNNAALDRCMQNADSRIISGLGGLDEWESTSAIYHLLLDLAADEPNRGSLLLKRLDNSKPRFGLVWFRNRKRDVIKKLPQNKEFNEMYDKHIVKPCESFVKQDYDIRGKELTLPQRYARLAYNACKKLVLDPNQLLMFPEAVTEEHNLAHQGKQPFADRFSASADE